MNFLPDFFKGILIGVGNIAPGVSGGALAMILGMYEKMVYAVGNFFKDIKKNILYLFPIGLGAVIGIIGFSRVLKYLLLNFPMQTTYTFAGLIVGTLPVLFKRANRRGFKKAYIVPFLITFAAGLTLAFIETGFVADQSQISIELNITNIVRLGILGFMIAGSIVIPGISGSVLLMLFGVYGIVLEAIASINILVLMPLAAGLGIGVLFFSRLMGFLLDRYYGVTYYAIIGFVIGAIPEVVSDFSFNFAGLISIIGFLVGLVTSYLISRLEKE